MILQMYRYVCNVIDKFWNFNPAIFIAEYAKYTSELFVLYDAQ